MKLDLTGEQVGVYNDIICIVNTVQYKILPLLTGYISTKDSYKRWKHQPDHHFTDQRKKFMKQLHKESEILRKVTRFLRRGST